MSLTSIIETNSSMMIISTRSQVLLWSCFQLCAFTNAFQVNSYTSVAFAGRSGSSLAHSSRVNVNLNVVMKNPKPTTPTPTPTRNGDMMLLHMANVDTNADSATSNSEIETTKSSFSFATPLDKPILAATDFFSLVVFAGVGKASHSGPDGALDLGAVCVTAFPFLLAWFATSPFTGVYKDNERNSDGGVMDAAKVAANGWIVAVPLGCALRGVIKGYVPPVPFVIVTMIVTLVLLGGTRMLYSVVEDKMMSNE